MWENFKERGRMRGKRRKQNGIKTRKGGKLRENKGETKGSLMKFKRNKSGKMNGTLRGNEGEVRGN